MIIAMAVLMFQFPAAAAANTVQKAMAPSEANPTADSQLQLQDGLPGAPVASVAVLEGSKAAIQTPVTSTSDGPSSEESSSRRVLVADAGMYIAPRPAAFETEDPISQPSNKTWTILTSIEHGSAAYDAWTTRRAIAHGRVEADPLMAPFAKSAALYGAIQIAPMGLDYLSSRMRRSSNWTRHIWWMPQAVATATYLFSGSYNVAHTN